MRKNYYISGGIIFLALAIIILVFCFNYKGENIVFPNKIEIMLDNDDTIYYARKRYVLWQYPTKEGDISGISYPNISIQNEITNIKEFLKDEEFKKFTSNFILNLETLRECNVEDIENIYFKAFTDDECVLSNEVQLENYKIELSVTNLNQGTKYYGEIMIVYPYNSIIKYNFKFYI